MEFSVRHLATLENLNRLKAFLFRHPDERKITVMIDREGQISLMQPIHEFEMHLRAFPKQTKIKYSAVLLIQDEKVMLMGESNRPFPMEHLPDIAKRIVRETLTIMNQLKSSDSTTLLSRLSALRLELAAEIERRPGWLGPISRQEAEKMLKNQNVGTYLLREGDIETREFEDNLRKSNPEPLRCYVLTRVDVGQKISDVLLIQRRDGWAIYNDDPQLSNYQYQKDFGQLISKLGVNRPIFRL